MQWSSLYLYLYISRAIIWSIMMHVLLIDHWIIILVEGWTGKEICVANMVGLSSEIRFEGKTSNFINKFN